MLPDVKIGEWRGAIEAFLIEARRPGPGAAGRGLIVTQAISVRQLVERYLQEAEQYYQSDGSPSREPENITHATRELLELFGDTPAHAFGPLALRKTRQAMIDRD